MSDVIEASDPARAEARQRVVKRRNLVSALVAYVVINAFLIGVWASTGAGYFWPGWILGCWGAGMVLAAWDYFRRPVSEADIERELRRRQ